MRTYTDNGNKPWPTSENNYIEMKQKAGIPPEKAYLCFDQKLKRYVGCSYKEFTDHRKAGFVI